MSQRSISNLVLILLGWLTLAGSDAERNLHAGVLTGHVRDQNWFARYQENPSGVGYYEYAVNANGEDITSLGGADDTDVFGVFSMNNLPAGSFTVVSWDVWWRSAYAFHVPVPSNGSSVDVDVRLRATMWGYPAFWDPAGYYEFGQTFVASGPVSMIYLRAPQSTSYTLSVRTGGPEGPPVGVSRGFSGAGDHRLIYGYGEMPTLAGQTYYVRIRTSSPAVHGVIRQMDPRPDYSDPMPGGCLWLGDGTTLTAYPDRDLGLIIMADDDGLLTNLYTRKSGADFSGVTSLGQTFVARGVNLISAAAWLADPSAPNYVVRVRHDGPSGAFVGTTKRGRPARLTADPEMIVAWAPGECPLEPGQTYYLEITRDGGGTFDYAFVNRSNPFPYGEAYLNGAPVNGVDLAGTLMEEESVGSATRAAVRFVAEPAIEEVDLGSDQLTVRWTTDVASDSRVEYAIQYPPYTATNGSSELRTDHAVTLSNLLAHTQYHYRVSSSASDMRPASSRDLVIVTRPDQTNWLVNPGFEEGTGPSPRATIPGWTKVGSLDIKASDGSWFNGLPPHSGGWLLEGAVNGGNADAYIYQRVSNTRIGETYKFSAWVTTWMRENGTYKYDVWNDPGRLSHMRLGIDPLGGTDPNAASIEWTPRMYSHLRYNTLAVAAEARTTTVTVFVGMQGQGGQWHLYGVDDCVLTPDVSPTASLEIERDGTKVVLRWEARGWRLQVAPGVTGPWLEVLGAASPYGTFIRPGQRVYRLARP